MILVSIFYLINLSQNKNGQVTTLCQQEKNYK